MLIRLLGLVYCVVLIVLSGCSSTQVVQSDEQPSQTIPLTIVKTPDIYIEQARVYLIDDLLTIEGTIQRDRLFGSNYHGHVDVILTNAKNQILKRMKVSYSTASLIPDGIRRTQFSLVVPIDAMSNAPTQVEVEVHRESDCALKAINS
jgi:hypothetical protein